MRAGSNVVAGTGLDLRPPLAKRPTPESQKQLRVSFKQTSNAATFQATREVLGPYLAIMEALAQLQDLQSNRRDEMEPPEMDAADDMGQQDAGAARSHDRPPKRARRTIVRFKAGPATPTR